MNVVGILLAAGRAQRFGAPKLLQPLPSGVPLGIAAARTLLEATPRVVAVVRPGDRALTEDFVNAGLEVVENPAADGGMGTSLAAGVDASADADAWLVALADMPWVRPGTARILADRLRNGASMVAPVYQGRRGHPVGFAAGWRERLRGLRGTAGARDLIAQHAGELELIVTDDAGTVHDVDRPADLASTSMPP